MNPQDKKIMWDGKGVTFRYMEDGKKFVAARRRYGNRDVCPLCKKAFTTLTTTSVYLIISNQVGIPNRFVHTECMKEKTPAYAFRLITENYQEALKYQDWFV